MDDDLATGSGTLDADGEGEAAPAIRVVKRARDGRLVWYRAKADPEFWHDYFLGKFTTKRIEGSRRRRLERDTLGRILAAALPRTGKIIEAGSGAGYWIATLEGNGYDVEGVEWSAKLVARVLEVAPDLPVRQGDVTALDVPDGHYAAYVSFGVVEHREEGPEPFLDEAFRILRPGGVAVITVPLFGLTRRLKAALGRYKGSVEGMPFYQYAFRPAEIRSYVEGAGFVVDRTTNYSIDRMFSEEIPPVGRIFKLRGRKQILAVTELLLGRFDGHMVAVVAHKPG